MSLSMYQASVPVFIRMLGNLSAILDKANAHAETKKITPAVLLGSRLALDMLPLSAQIQIACDSAARGTARLAGVDLPSFPDTETSIADFQARIARTIEFVKTVRPEQIDGSEGRSITMPMRTGEVKFQGQDFLLHFALPNFYFHITTAYAILRHNGLDIGKMDFIGKP